MRRGAIGDERNPKRGVTILEVLVVLTIIALIGAVVGPRLIGYLGRAKSEAAGLQIQQIKSATQLFYIDMGRYPTDAEGLSVLMVAPAGAADWAGPYLENDSALTDPWGRAYSYAEPSDPRGAPQITSLGRDGVRGGTGEDADIGS